MICLRIFRVIWWYPMYQCVACQCSVIILYRIIGTVIGSYAVLLYGLSMHEMLLITVFGCHISDIMHIIVSALRLLLHAKFLRIFQKVVKFKSFPVCLFHTTLYEWKHQIVAVQHMFILPYVKPQISLV